MGLCLWWRTIIRSLKRIRTNLIASTIYSRRIEFYFSHFSLLFHDWRCTRVATWSLRHVVRMLLYNNSIIDGTGIPKPHLTLFLSNNRNRLNVHRFMTLRLCGKQLNCFRMKFSFIMLWAACFTVSRHRIEKHATTWPDHSIIVPGISRKQELLIGCYICVRGLWVHAGAKQHENG